MNNVAKRVLFFIFVVVLLLGGIFLLMGLKKQNEKEEASDSNKTTIRNFKKELADNNNIKTEEVDEYNINKDYKNYYNNKNHEISIIVNEYENREGTIEELLNGQKQQFNTLLEEQIKIKYPLFIANELIKEETTKTYIFSNSGIEVNFTNYNTNPVYEGKTSIKLTCDMINGLVDTNCIEKTETNPNIPTLDPTKTTIALTFDDGPNANTRRILQTLSDNNVTATFFMLGQNMTYYPTILKEVAESDNEIASHTYSHKYLTKIDGEELSNEINKPYEILANVTDKKIKYIRPPYGSIDKNALSYINKPIILWSVDPEDWRFRNVDTIYDNVISSVGDGDIVLLHDIHSTTADALEKILPELYVRGIQVTSVGKLAELKNKNLENNTLYRNLK